MVLNKWDSLQIDIQGYNMPIKIDRSQFSSCGFLEVYPTLEDFKKLYPDEEPMVVESEKKNED